MLNNKIKTLKVAILGEPNTGKSTLFNTLIKKKYSIVTRKAQTTRRKTTAVLVKEKKQIIFTDTPGITTNKKNIDRGMFKEASNVVFEVDLVLLLFNIKKDNIENIKASVEYFEKNQIEIVLLLNKIDLLSKEIFYKRVSAIKNYFKNKIIFSISGKKNIGVDQFINQLIGVAVVGAFSLVCAGVIIFAIKTVVGIRVSEEDELKGLDISEHSMDAYADFSTNKN